MMVHLMLLSFALPLAALSLSARDKDAFKLTLADGQLRGETIPSKPVEGGGKLTITLVATRRQ